MCLGDIYSWKMNGADLKGNITKQYPQPLYWTSRHGDNNTRWVISDFVPIIYVIPVA